MYEEDSAAAFDAGMDGGYGYGTPARTSAPSATDGAAMAAPRKHSSSAAFGRGRGSGTSGGRGSGTSGGRCAIPEVGRGTVPSGRCAAVAPGGRGSVPAVGRGRAGGPQNGGRGTGGRGGAAGFVPPHSFSLAAVVDDSPPLGSNFFEVPSVRSCFCTR
uniref:Uncharacterized protein n=1 Tax=Arundo donax TaxID=35708 RepID=A0A0A9AEI5_ARUDO